MGLFGVLFTLFDNFIWYRTDTSGPARHIRSRSRSARDPGRVGHASLGSGLTPTTRVSSAPARQPRAASSRCRWVSRRSATTRLLTSAT